MSTRRTRSSSKNRSNSESETDESTQVNGCKVVKDDQGPNVNNNNRVAMKRKSKGKINAKGRDCPSKKSKIVNTAITKGRKVRSVVKKVQNDKKENDSDSDEGEQFEEDGNLIKMRVNPEEDNFESEDETENESESEEDKSDRESESGNEQSTDNEGSVMSEGEVRSPRKSPGGRSDRSRKKKGKRSKRQMEEQISQLSDAVFALQNVVAQNVLTNEQKEKLEDRRIVKSKGDSVVISNSETTIYDSALKKANQPGFDQINVDEDISFNMSKNRQTLNVSSDEQADTSDELMNVTDQFIADCAAEAERCRSVESNVEGRTIGRSPNPNVEIARTKIREAEASRVRAQPSAGNLLNETLNKAEMQVNAVSVDDHYMIVGAHLDSSIKHKILQHDYIDFARLLPRDRITHKEDHRMELINKNGNTYFVPVSDRECAGGINNFNKWEQAFRIFSNIYTKFFPHRASKLIQYNHVIFTAAQSYVWDNVYLYDKEFRMHLSNFPERSWAVILQQAWSICLRDKIRRNAEEGKFSSPGQNKPKRENCKRFNKGKCTSGTRCQFEHRCDVCGKWGHGAHICRNRKSPNNNKTIIVAMVNAGSHLQMAQVLMVTNKYVQAAINRHMVKGVSYLFNNVLLVINSSE